MFFATFPFPRQLFSTRHAARHCKSEDVHVEAFRAQFRNCRCENLNLEACFRDGNTNVHLCQSPHGWCALLLAYARAWGRQEDEVEERFRRGHAERLGFVTEHMEGIGQLSVLGKVPCA